MKKSMKVLLVTLVFALVIGLTSYVSAAFVTEGEGVYIGYNGSNVTVSKDEQGVYNLELTGTATQELVVRSGETVVLDLKGQTFQNYTTACAPIEVQEGGTLTIKDSVGGGTISLLPNSAYAVIANHGTLTIEGGEFIQSAWGGLLNYGTAIIKDGTFRQTADASWSLIDNKGSLTIDGGNFYEGDEFYLIRNESEVVINGGTFTTNAPATSLIGNFIEEEDKTDNTNITMKITNGEFSAPSIVLNNYPGHDLEVSGGTFTSENSFVVNNWGNCTVTGGTLTSENNSAIRVVYSDGAEKPSLNIADTATIVSAQGQEDITIRNDSEDIEVGTAVDENGNTVAGEIAITAEDVTCEVGDTATLNVTVTVGGVKVVANGLNVESSDENIVKVNDDNTLTAIAEGTANVTVSYGGVSTQVAVNVTKKEAVDPEDPTTDPENPVTDPENPTTPEEPVNPEDPTNNNQEETNNNEEVKEPNGEEIVQTGDYIYIVIGAVVLIVVANVVYTIRKRNHK